MARRSQIGKPRFQLSLLYDEESILTQSFTQVLGGFFVTIIEKFKAARAFGV